MISLLAIDPGRNLGFAHFEHELYDCGLSVAPDRLRDAPSIAGYHMQSFLPAHRVVTEQQTVSTGRDGVGHARLVAMANDLILLTGISALIAGRMGQEWVQLRPAKCPKEVVRAQVLHVLSPAEHDVLSLGLKKAPKSKHHNVFDAVHLGLRARGRL